MAVGAVPRPETEEAKRVQPDACSSVLGSENPSLVVRALSGGGPIRKTFYWRRTLLEFLWVFNASGDVEGSVTAVWLPWVKLLPVGEVLRVWIHCRRCTCVDTTAECRAVASCNTMKILSSRTLLLDSVARRPEDLKRRVPEHGCRARSRRFRILPYWP